MYDYSNPNQDPPDYGDPDDWTYYEKVGQWLYMGDDQTAWDRYQREFDEFEELFFSGHFDTDYQRYLRICSRTPRVRTVDDLQLIRQFEPRTSPDPIEPLVEEPVWLTYWYWGLAGFILMCGVILLL